MAKENFNKQKAIVRIADHLANERTFLSWLRLCIGIMAFGFVVERFALFAQQMAVFLGRDSVIIPRSGTHWLPLLIGELLVGFAIIIGILAYYQYRQVREQIEKDTYYPAIWLSSILFFFVIIIGGCLTFYLFHNYAFTQGLTR